MIPGLDGILDGAAMQQRIAEAFHYDTYATARTSRPELERDLPRPNSPGYQTLWSSFQHDALVAMRVIGFWVCSKDNT